MGEGGNPLEDKEEASAEQRTDKGHKCVTELGGSVEFFWRPGCSKQGITSERKHTRKISSAEAMISVISLGSFK